MTDDRLPARMELVYADIKLTNGDDLALARRKLLDPSKVRAMTVWEGVRRFRPYSSWPMLLHDAQHTSRDHRPFLQAPERSANGQWSVGLVKELNSVPTVEASDDLQTWTPMAVPPAGATNRSLTIPDDTQKNRRSRFYRAR